MDDAKEIVDKAIEKHERKYHKKIRAGDSQYSAEFELFWKKFKGRWDKDFERYIKRGKNNAWLVWQCLTKAQQETAIAVADKVCGRWTPDAERWLKQKYFDDFTVKNG